MSNKNSNVQSSFNEGVGLKKKAREYGKAKAGDTARKAPKATPDKAPKKPKKRLPQPIRGIANWLNEEKAAAQEDGATVKKLKKKPKY